MSAVRGFLAAACAVCLGSAFVPGTAHAQDSRQAGEANATPAVVKYGKWGAAALFAAFTAAGAVEHDEAESRFHALEAWCLGTGPCILGPDGRYTSPEAESRYQAVISRDHAARAWFLSGQIAMGGAAALFIIELLHEHGTRNIPYSGLVVQPGRAGATNVGLRVPF